MWVERNGPTWRILDRVNGSKVTLASGFPTKPMAEDGMAQLYADKLRGDALVPRGSKTTLAQFVEQWWPTYERSLKPSARQSEGSRLRMHILHLMGDMELGEIDAITVRKWVAMLEAGEGGVPAGMRARRPLAAKTVHNCHGLLFVIMAAAVGDRLIRLNPCAATPLPKREHYEMRFLTDPEIRRLLEALPAHWRPLVLLLVGTGLRWGEAIGLRVKNLDLLAAKPRLRVLEHLHELNDGSLVWTDPKSKQSRRTVSFTLQIALALTPLVVDKAPTDVVFTTPTGLTIRTRNFRRVWLKAIKDAGLEGLRVHDLRHTHAAILISAGRPLSAISRRLGHSSIAVTDTLYGHIREEADDGILAAIDAALSTAPRGDLEAEIEGELTPLDDLL